MRTSQNHSVRTVGLDLSPYMLAVAKVQDEKGAIAQWIHTRAEDTGLSERLSTWSRYNLSFTSCRATLPKPSFAKPIGCCGPAAVWQ